MHRFCEFVSANYEAVENAGLGCQCLGCSPRAVIPVIITINCRRLQAAILAASTAISQCWLYLSHSTLTLQKFLPNFWVELAGGFDARGAGVLHFDDAGRGVPVWGTAWRAAGA
jgi:hypothetical protein